MARAGRPGLTVLTEVPLPLRDRRDGGSRPGAHPAARTVRETRGLLTVIAGALLLSGLDALLGAGTGLSTGPAVLAVLSGATAVVLVRGARARGADGRPWTAFAAACALISLRSENEPGCSFVESGSARAASLNAAVLRTTPCSTRVRPMSPAVWPGSTWTSTSPLPAPS